jgi:hypothetical protein
MATLDNLVDSVSKAKHYLAAHCRRARNQRIRICRCAGLPVHGCGQREGLILARW